MIDIVNAVLFRNGHVLVAKRSEARRNYAGMWSFAGGHVEPGESLEEALERELREELAITVLDYSPLLAIDDTNNDEAAPARFHHFLVTNWVGEPTIVDEEHSELAWLTPKEASGLQNLAMKDYRRLFEMLMDQDDRSQLVEKKEDGS